MTNENIWMLYSTFPNREKALSVARVLVEKRLVACVNLYDNILSVYRWQETIQQEQEVALMAKTREGKVSSAMETLKSLHPYEVPCIVAYPVAEGFPPFLQWVADETG
jgi:periplasmic divalent cation tolerance protein